MHNLTNQYKLPGKSDETSTKVLLSDHFGLISESESVLDSTLHISWIKEIKCAHTKISHNNTGADFSKR